MICDFCSSPAPAWRYPASSFHDIVGSRSVEDWVACEECHALITAGDRDGLARRSVMTSGVQTALSILGEDFTYAYCRDLHDRFWRARRGTPYKVAA